MNDKNVLTNYNGNDFGFYKISFNQFVEDWCKIYNDNEPNLDIIRDIYDDIIIPRRSTHSSAGYDFFIPFNILIPVGKCITIPTGIRACFPDNMVLLIYPRSGLGFRHGVKLTNTVGVIDSDYYNAKNEGHIMIKIKYEDVDDIQISTNNMIPKNTNEIDTVDNLIFNPVYYTETDNVSNNNQIHKKTLKLDKGTAFSQGIFTFFNIFSNEDKSVMKTRTGGFGSTDK